MRLPVAGTSMNNGMAAPHYTRCLFIEEGPSAKSYDFYPTTFHVKQIMNMSPGRVVTGKRQMEPSRERPWAVIAPLITPQSLPDIQRLESPKADEANFSAFLHSA